MGESLSVSVRATWISVKLKKMLDGIGTFPRARRVRKAWLMAIIRTQTESGAYSVLQPNIVCRIMLERAILKV